MKTTANGTTAAQVNERENRVYNPNEPQGARAVAGAASPDGVTLYTISDQSKGAQWATAFRNAGEAAEWLKRAAEGVGALSLEAVDVLKVSPVCLIWYSNRDNSYNCDYVADKQGEPLEGTANDYAEELERLKAEHQEREARRRGMEPRIIKGHLYRCIRDVMGRDRKKNYKAGKVYACEVANYYPTPGDTNARHTYGHITNEHGDKHHAWPYDPKNCPMCCDRWTEFFEDLGEKPEGVILCPYQVGDTVKWYCDDDGKVHTSKIQSMEAYFDDKGQPAFTYYATTVWKGQRTRSSFGLYEIRRAYQS